MNFFTKNVIIREKNQGHLIYILLYTVTFKTTDLFFSVFTLSKQSVCLLHSSPTKLLKDALIKALILNIISLLLSMGWTQQAFNVPVINPLLKKLSLHLASLS